MTPSRDQEALTPEGTAKTTHTQLEFMTSWDVRNAFADSDWPPKEAERVRHPHLDKAGSSRARNKLDAAGKKRGARGHGGRNLGVDAG